MGKLSFDLDVDQQTPTKNQTSQPNNSQEQRRLSIERCDVPQPMQTSLSATQDRFDSINLVEQPLTSQQPQMYAPTTNPIVSKPRPTQQSRPHLQEQMTRILGILKNNQGQQTAECLQMMRENPQLMAMFLRLHQQQQQQQQQ